MDYSGLTGKYLTHRLLTTAERRFELKQRIRLDIEPAYQLSVIRTNSNYLELVDKYFAWKGFITLFAVVAFVLVGSSSIYATLSVAHDAIMWNDPNESAPWIFVAIVFSILIGSFWAFIKVFRYESFAYTHYPIRFDRANKSVHFYRTNGSTLSADWEKIFFCLANIKRDNWEIQAHILSEDRGIVLETFCAFPQIGGNEAEREQLRHHWEFIRRYMEEGPEDAYQRTKICLPISDGRESLSFGFHRMHLEGKGNPLASVLIALMAIVILPGRYIAMHTSKIPQWPADVEAVNRVTPDDPFVRDASMNEKSKELPDWLWLSISAIVWAGIVYGVSSMEPWR